MTLLMANATISTTSTSGAIGPKLTRVPAYVAPPTEKDQLMAGGIVKHVVLLDPGQDVQPGDAMLINTWGQHTDLTARPFHVFAADPEGGIGLEVLRCVIGEKVQR